MARGKKKQHRPGKLGFDGVEDDGAAQSKFKGLSSGAKAALRKKMEERTSGETEPAFEPPSVQVQFVDCLFFASEVWQRRDAVLAAAQDLRAQEEDAQHHTSNVFDAFTLLGGPRCDAAIPAYAALCEMDAHAGDLRYRAWEQHRPRHAAFGLEAHGLALVGAAMAEAEGDGATRGSGVPSCDDGADGPLATLLEMWDSSICVAAGPLSLSYSADGLSDDASRLNQLRGLARLLREALARRLPVVLTCDAEAEADMARLALASLAKAPPPTSPPPAPRPGMDGLPEWKACTPFVVYESAGLWERLAAGWPGCAFMLFDGSLTFSKAPRTLLNVAFDVPAERILLASSAPRNAPARPAQRAESNRPPPCHPAHVLQTAQRLAALRGTPDSDTVDAESILSVARENARLVFPALGLPPLDVELEQEARAWTGPRQQPHLHDT